MLVFLCLMRLVQFYVCSCYVIWESTLGTYSEEKVSDDTLVELKMIASDIKIETLKRLRELETIL